MDLVDFDDHSGLKWGLQYIMVITLILDTTEVAIVIGVRCLIIFVHDHHSDTSLPALHQASQYPRGAWSSVPHPGYSVTF
jgi:hypothetical protein